MKVSAKSGTTIEPIPAGVHNAICISVIGIGLQESPWGPKEQLIITWELPDITFEYEGEIKPKVHSQFYSATLGGGDKPSALRKLLEGWRGRPFSKEEEAGFELKNLLGVPCLLVMQAKKDGIHTEISAASKYTGSAMSPVNPLVYYDANDHDQAAFDGLHDWIKDRIIRPGLPEPTTTTPAPAYNPQANIDAVNAELLAVAGIPEDDADDLPF